MVYRFIGRLVVKGVKALLRYKYGPTMMPRPVLAGAVVAVVVGVALAASRRDDAA